MKRLFLILVLLTVCRSALRAQPDPATVFAWFKADAGIITNASGSVINWQNQATSITNSAARDLNQINGAPATLNVSNSLGVTTVLRLDGTDSVWGTVGNFGSLTSNRTVVTYCRLTLTNDGFLFDGSTTNGQTRAQVRSGSWQVGLQPSGGGANADTPTLPATNGVWQAHVFMFEPLVGSIRVTHSIAGGGTFVYTNTPRRL